MNILIDLVARWLYNRTFAKFGLKPSWFRFSWGNESEDVKESWRKEARRKIYFWKDIQESLKSSPAPEAKP